MQTSRSRIVDGIETIANSIAMCSHLQENLNSYGKNDEITQADAELCSQQILVYTRIRRDLMSRIMNEYDGNRHYWCALKHAIAVWGLMTEILYANPGDFEIMKMQQDASDSMYSILSTFIKQPVTTCGRCFADILQDHSLPNPETDVKSS